MSSRLQGLTWSGQGQSLQGLVFKSVSSYHGGDMEGKSVQRHLMGQGTAIFKEIQKLPL
jgi:hypothetical protein